MPTIHANIYDPTKIKFFKTKANEKAELRTVTCARSADCQVYARGECIALNMFSRCKHGREVREEGHTRRHSKYRQWINEAAKRVEGVGTLKMATPKVARVGDFMWLPYAHMGIALTGEIRLIGSWHNDFLPAEEFTVDLIVRLCTARPRAMFGDEITSYQKESVPQFVSHLAEMYPEMLAEAAARSERIREIIASITKVGRKARLLTLTPNVGTFRNREREWVWDGTYLATKDEKSALGDSICMPVKAAEIRIKPVEDAVVTITDDGQVNANTVFVD